MPRIFNPFIAVKFPDDVTLPIHLHHIQLILKTEIGITQSRAAEDKAAGQELVGKAPQPFPKMNLLAAHINKQSPYLCSLE
ncbi:hypothetical protein D3C75_891870 [compost metagenome]